MPANRTDIFAFPVGEKTLYADPLVVYGRFMEAVDGDVAVLLERAYPPPPAPGGQAQAEEEPAGLQAVRVASRVQIAAAMLHALGLPPLDRETGEGFTAAQGEEFYHLWLDQMEAVKKKPDTSPTSSPATRATPADRAASMRSAAPWTASTPSSSACG